jgi:16S rRNA processing protein RimM
MPETNGLILIGKISGTHGIRGQVRIVPYSGDPGSITSLRTLLLSAPHGNYESFEIAGATEHKKRALVTFRGLDHIDQALPLVGREVYVRRDQLPELPEGEFYWYDLMGVAVTTEDGENLGEIADILETGGNDVYVVRSGEREFLIPATTDVVLEVDLDHRKMVVRPLEGLLDL